MPAFAVLLQSTTRAGSQVVSDIAGKPIARLRVEVVIAPAPVVTHRFPEGALDVDERKMVQHVPDENPTELPHGNAPAEKLMLGPERRAVHVEQRAVEIEEGGGS